MTQRATPRAEGLSDKMVDLVFRVSLFVLLYRTLMLATYPLLGDNPLGHDFLADRFHHYQAGLAFILLGLLLHWRWKISWVTLLALPVAMVLEEYPIILSDLGLRAPYPYLSSRDNAIVYLLGLSGVVLAYGAKKARRAGAPHKAE